jgi:hypothetical protein
MTMASSAPITVPLIAKSGADHSSPQVNHTESQPLHHHQATPVEMSGQKRDYNGVERKQHDGGHKKGAGQQKTVPVVRNEYTRLFERFRDELDQHHERREKIVKASRDITALSKKM